MSVFWTVVTLLGYLLTLLLIPIVLLTGRKHPSATVAWIMAIVMLPFVGGLLFLVFGINRVDRRAARKQQASRAIGRRLPELSQYQILPEEAESPRHQRLMRLATRMGETSATVGNLVELIVDTNRALGLMEQAILTARETIHLEYYIWQPDRTGTRLRNLLIERAREGVQIRLLYDSFGSLYLSRRFLKPMRDVGIQVATFLPGPTLRERWSLNLRNHRKITLVDGQVGFTGGMNIGDEYHGRVPAFGYWRDTHLRLQGPAVLQLQQVFVEDWYYATGEELVRPELFPAPEEFGDAAAQLLADEPAGDQQVFLSVLFAAINEAQEQITLTASYFVPPDPLLSALETAAHRGVRVRLMVAGRTSYLWTFLAGRSYYETLLRAGVEIYEYEQGLLHSKTLTVDGSWSLVGTTNFDFRSFFLNFEVGMVLYDFKIAQQLEAQFERDVERCRRIEPEKWERRPVWERLGENACRLFAPVL